MPDTTGGKRDSEEDVKKTMLRLPGGDQKRLGVNTS